MQIDVDAIQGMLDIYRSALDNKIPVAPMVQEHFKQHRRLLLDGFKKMASAQNLILGSLKAENDAEAAQLDEAKRIVAEFRAWAENA